MRDIQANLKKARPIVLEVRVRPAPTAQARRAKNNTLVFWVTDLRQHWNHEFAQLGITRITDPKLVQRLRYLAPKALLDAQKERPDIDPFAPISRRKDVLVFPKGTSQHYAAVEIVVVVCLPPKGVRTYEVPSQEIIAFYQFYKALHETIRIWAHKVTYMIRGIHWLHTAIGQHLLPTSVEALEKELKSLSIINSHARARVIGTCRAWAQRLEAEQQRSTPPLYEVLLEAFGPKKSVEGKG